MPLVKKIALSGVLVMLVGHNALDPARAQTAASAPTAVAAPAQQVADASVPAQPQTGQNAPQAQAVASMTTSESSAMDRIEQSIAAHVALEPGSVVPPDLKSLFFTSWQHALLAETRQNYRDHPLISGSGKTTGPREISLGGISYRDAKNWTVWLNSQRVKPDALPPQVLSFNVARDHVDLKWFDDASNLIYPIRLHPHERFNLDNRIFLPGAGLDAPVAHGT